MKLSRWFWLALITACDGSAIAPTDASVRTPRDGGIVESSRDGGESDAGPMACTDGIADEPGVVKTTYAAYRGVELGTNTRVFRGIRFGAPPLGAARWKPAGAPGCETQIVDATDFAPMCPQIDEGVVVGDEDCLFLNVWAPKDAVQRPVLVFIHGGGNAQGSATHGPPGDLLYDGLPLAEKQGAIIVTIQYRLAILGWMVHDDLENGGGNFGLLDQIAALQWVRDNIAAFGGDPSRVTIFGESAGARNVCVLVASPPAANLFSGAIMESGGCVVPGRDLVLAESAAHITDANCDGPDPLACLEAMSVEELLLARPAVVDVAGRSSQLQPTIDGRALLGNPIDVIAAGEHNHVATIVGANADETSMSVPPIADVAAYEALVRATFGAVLGNRVLAEYDAADFASPRAAYVALTTDGKFVCGARSAARAFTMGQTEPVYRYFFTKGLENAPRQRAFGAFHGVELPFVFDRLDLGGYRPTPVESALAATIGAYWVGLANAGDPNVAGEPTWPAYEAAADRTLVLGETIEAVDGIRTGHCDFWDAL